MLQNSAGARRMRRCEKELNCPRYLRLLGEVDSKRGWSVADMTHMQERIHRVDPCQFGRECQALVRLLAGGNDTGDAVHVHVYRHPMRGVPGRELGYGKSALAWECPACEWVNDALDQPCHACDAASPYIATDTSKQETHRKKQPQDFPSHADAPSSPSDKSAKHLSANNAYKSSSSFSAGKDADTTPEHAGGLSSPPPGRRRKVSRAAMIREAHRLSNPQTESFENDHYTK